MCGKVAEFVWGRWLVCQFLCGEVVNFCVGEGARICVRGRWSGGLNLCAGKVDRRRADDPCGVGQVCVGQQVCEGTRLSTAISPSSALERIYSQTSALGVPCWVPFALMYGEQGT